MADEKNITVEQFKDFAEKADSRLDKLETGKADKPEVPAGRKTRMKPFLLLGMPFPMTRP